MNTTLPFNGGLDPNQLAVFAKKLAEIHEEMKELELETMGNATGIQRVYYHSARNLIHYLAIRRHDVRQLQEGLASIALSSLGRAESHVKLTVEKLLQVIHRLMGSADLITQRETMGVAEWRALLEDHTVSLLGPKPADRNVRIMVTMPSEAAFDYHLVRDLLAEGMDCIRINCAHDDVEVWDRMVSNLSKARKETGRHCRIMMDLPGPKLRTGPIEPAPQVSKWRPHRDTFGRVTAPARIWITPISHPRPAPASADACIPVTGDWLSRLKVGDVVKFFDARDASRVLSIVAADGECRWAESYQTTYVAPGTPLQLRRTDNLSSASMIREGRVGELSAIESKIILKRGDSLILTSDLLPGAAAVYDNAGRLIEPARIGMTLPEVFSDIREGETVWLDDGKIGGRVKRVTADEIEAEIVNCSPEGERLKSDKGINLPDTDIHLSPLTERDLECLAFIASSADLVGYSFVRRASDVHELQDRLRDMGAESAGIVLKIETRTAFEQLPALLLAAMRSPSAGVMIARGDLAVECGFERLAEVQEELLWICEAAHVPVIWATQVLESMAKTGLPSRAEITDAAMGERAECVMLNKGPYVVEAVRALNGILGRMQGHQTKKTPMLRRLRVARRFKAKN